MKSFIRHSIAVFLLFAALFSATESSAAKYYSRPNARNTINKTAYIIDQAYEVAAFYNYWSSNYLSKAVYYNDYAQYLFQRRAYRSAINYSLRAREYALIVLDNCDDYWEFFYFTYYGWSFRFGYNPNFAYANGYMDGYYDGYYASYCDRHNHNYRNDPYYRPNGHYNDYPKTSTTVIGRGNTGAISSNGGSSSLGRTGYTGSESTGNYKNLKVDEYFSTEELKALSEMPKEKEMENDFRQANPSVSFNDNALKNNKTIMEKNKTTAKNFTADNADSQTLKRMTVSKPQTIKVQTQSKESTVKNTEIKRSSEKTANIKPTNTTQKSNSSLNRNNTSNAQKQKSVEPKKQVTTKTTTQNKSNAKQNKTDNSSKQLKRK